MRYNINVVGNIIMFGLILRRLTSMSNPDRYDYDSDKYYYDEENDVLTAWDTDESYTGDGEKITSYSD